MNVLVSTLILDAVQNEPIGLKLLIGSIRGFVSNGGMVMFARQLTTVSLLSLALISLPGLAHAQSGPLAYCKEDAARLCPGVTPGGGKLIGCLKQHENEVSIGCAKELKAIKAKMGK